MKFEFQLRDASPLIAGEGTVVWTRKNDPSRPAIAPGMGVRFDRLADGSQNGPRAHLGGEGEAGTAASGNEATTKPPMFTDTPTRVAPGSGAGGARVRSKRKRRGLRADAAAEPDAVPLRRGGLRRAARSRRRRRFARSTSLPRTSAGLGRRLFGSGGTVATPVAAPSRRQTTAVDERRPRPSIMPPDELAARRAAAARRLEPPAEEPPTSPSPADMIDRDSAAGPSVEPPERRSRKNLDTTPSPRRVRSARRAHQALRRRRRRDAGTDSAATPRAVAAESSQSERAEASEQRADRARHSRRGRRCDRRRLVPRDSRRRRRRPSPSVEHTGSAGSAQRESSRTTVARQRDASPTTAARAALTSSSGSAGSAVASNDRRQRQRTAPAAPTVDTVIASSVVEGRDRRDPRYRSEGAGAVHREAREGQGVQGARHGAGLFAAEIDVKGGQEKATAKLVGEVAAHQRDERSRRAPTSVDGVTRRRSRRRMFS